MTLRKSTLRLFVGSLILGNGVLHGTVDADGPLRDPVPRASAHTHVNDLSSGSVAAQRLFQTLDDVLNADPAPAIPPGLVSGSQSATATARAGAAQTPAKASVTDLPTTETAAADKSATSTAEVEASDMTLVETGESPDAEQADDAGSSQTENAAKAERPQTLAPSEGEIVAAPEPKITEPKKEANPPIDTAAMAKLQRTIDLCLAHHYVNPDNPATRSNWGVMHSMLSFGTDTRLVSNGRRFNAVGWLCWNQPCRGQRLMERDGSQLDLRIGPGFQGHEGQFLAMLAQIGVPRTQILQIDNRRYTVDDLIKHEMATCKEKSELTFKLIGLAHYLPTTTRWRDRDGKQWDFEKLIEEELDQPVIGAACGGTHRMMGFSFAVKKRKTENQPLTGEWLRAKKYVDSYIEYTMQLQNPDGSFSTAWFESRGANPEIGRRLQTTGHILEWLIFSLPPERLHDQEIKKSVTYLANLIWENRDKKWDVGPKGHALRALALYNDLVFDKKMGDGGVRLTRLANQHGLH